MSIFQDILKKAQQFAELGKQVGQTGKAQLTASLLKSKTQNKPMEFKVGEGLSLSQTEQALKTISGQIAPEVKTILPKPRVAGLDPDIFIPQKINELVGQGFSIQDAETQAIGEATKLASLESGTVWIFNKKKTKEGNIVFEPTGIDIMGSVQPLRNVAKETTKKVAEKVISVVDDPVKKLTETLNKFKSLRGKQEAIYTAERGVRFGAAEKTFSQKGGEAGAFGGLGKLKGEFSKVQLSGKLQKELRDSIKQGGVDELYNIVQGNKWMTTGEKLTSISGLRKVFGGEIPTEGELEIMETVFGKDFADSLRIAQPWKFTVWNVASEVGAVMKILSTSLGDLSAFGRQLITYTTRHPIKGIKLLKTGARSGISESFYNRISKEIVSNEYYPLAKRFNVPFTEMSDATTKLSRAEEQFLSRFIKNIPVVGNIVKGTERAYNVMVNKARADWFYGLTDDLLKAGYDPIQNPEAFKKAAKFTGSFTGRGDLGKVLNDASELMNFFIFSPRLIKSRLDIIASPISYLNAPSPVRKEVWKTLLSYYGTMGLILSGASLAGYEVETDSTSSDFLKIKKRNTRVDISGGLQPYYRVLGQILNQSRKVGMKKTDVNTLDILSSFARGKLSPIASLGMDVVSGKNFVGEPITPSNLLYEHFTNLIIQDISDASKEVGWLNAVGLVAPLGILGIGVQTYERKPSKRGTGGLPGLKDRDLPGLPGSGKQLPKLPGL